MELLRTAWFCLETVGTGKGLVLNGYSDDLVKMHLGNQQQKEFLNHMMNLHQTQTFGHLKTISMQNSSTV